MQAVFRNLPWSIFVLSGAIYCFGLLGLQRADQLYGATRLFERQLLWAVIAIAAAGGIVSIPYRSLRPFSSLAFLVCVVLLVLVLFMPPVNGSRRWIPLGFIDFQPSEPARLAFILALAERLMHRSQQLQLTGLIVPFLIAFVPLLLVLKEPDLGTALLFIPVLFAMLFAAGANTRYLLAAVVLGIAGIPVLWSQMNPEQRSRVVSVFRQQDGGSAPSGDGFHLHQSKQILALGGLTGRDPLDDVFIDDPSALQLPAARTDFIFVVIGERFGTAGCVSLLALYAALIWKGLLIARSTREPFGRLVAVGIVVMLGTQVLINTSMTVGLMPITGITLPLVSYGGSSLLSTSLAIGLLVNIAMRPGYEVTRDPFTE